jgi:hypothetical protein
MKVFTLSLLLAIAPISFGNFSDCLPTNDNTVYICTGNSSKKYHANSKCRGLGGCKGTIKAISKEEAIKMGRTPCGICKP